MALINQVIAYFSRLPTNQSDLWIWIISIAGCHLVLGIIIRSIRGDNPFSAKAAANGFGRASEALAVGTSIMLLLSLSHPLLAKLLGDTKPFLGLVGLFGIYQGFLSLGRPD